MHVLGPVILVRAFLKPRSEQLVLSLEHPAQYAPRLHRPVKTHESLVT